MRADFNDFCISQSFCAVMLGKQDHGQSSTCQFHRISYRSPASHNLGDLIVVPGGCVLLREKANRTASMPIVSGSRLFYGVIASCFITTFRCCLRFLYFTYAHALIVICPSHVLTVECAQFLLLYLMYMLFSNYVSHMKALFDMHALLRLSILFHSV